MYRWSSGALAGVAGAAAPLALGALPRSSDQTPDTSHSGPSPIDLQKSCTSIPACASRHGSDRRIRQPMESNRLRGRWSGGATCATHQKFQRACFVLLGFEPGRLLGGDDTRAGTCTVERHDRRGLIASGRHELEREGYIDGAAIGECERHEEPQAVA